MQKVTGSTPVFSTSTGNIEPMFPVSLFQQPVTNCLEILVPLIEALQKPAAYHSKAVSALYQNLIEKPFLAMRGWLVGDIFSCELKDFSMENPKHTLAYIKRQAKKIKKERGISHIEALNMVSKSCGYSNWMHCNRSLNQEKDDNVKTTDESIELSFIDWLKRHSNRNSPLGDLSKDVAKNENWPLNNSIDDHRSYLLTQKLPYGALDALNRAWKSYRTYLKKKENPDINRKTIKKPVPKNHDQRKIVYLKNITPIHFSKRTVEKFAPGDKAWVSWDGRKAIPVTVTDADDSHYSFKIERPVKKAGDGYWLFLDEVRSTPELACINCRTS